MAELKVRPKMDKPKLREAMTAPKDASSRMREHYEAQQREKQPGVKSPERYATERVEGAAKGTAFLAADRMGKTMQKQHRQQKQEGGSEREKTVPPRGKEAARSANDELHPFEVAQPVARNKREPQRSKLVHRRVLDERVPMLLRTEKTTSPTPHSAEERGRRLARAKYQETRKQRTEVRVWERGGERPTEEALLANNHPRVREKEMKQALAGEKYSSKAPTEKRNQSDGREARVVQRSVTKAPRRKQTKAPTRDYFQNPRWARSFGRGAETREKMARQFAQKKTQRELLKESTAAGRKAASAGGHALKELAASAGRSAAKTVSMLSASGAALALTVLFLLMIAIGALTASPFGILFAGESAGAESVPVSAAVAQVNQSFNAKLEALQSGDYDRVTLEGDTADWVEILAVFAVKTAGPDTAEAMDVVTLDRNRIENLEKVFLDMNVITTEVEEIHHPGGKDDPGWTEYILHITITPRTAEEMMEEYHFTQQQQAALGELLEQRELLEALIGDLFHVSAEVGEVLRELPEELSEERKAVVREACSLVGKVGYFWGGKSMTLGWDSRWGQIKEVTAEGSPTTGTYRPYGLDCSGFVDWVFYNATQGKLVLGQGGGAKMQHRACTPISWSEALPGDLVFYPGDTHVGIVCGKKDNGELLIVHCASAANHVVITGKAGFTAAARPSQL